jgi:valyl-tRNA synthetase
VLDQTVRLLHPFIPFITEGIFQKLNEIAPVRKLQGLAGATKSEALVIAEWPNKIEFLIDEKAEDQISTIQSPIRAVRDIKNKYNIAHTTKPATSVTTTVQVATILNENSALISNLAGVKNFEAGPDIVKPKSAATAIVDDIQVYVHDVIDVEAERRRLKKQKEQVEKAKKGVEARLRNENFLSKAKPKVVAQAREKLARLAEQLKTLEKNLSQLES